MALGQPATDPVKRFVIFNHDQRQAERAQYHSHSPGFYLDPTLDPNTIERIITSRYGQAAES
jgi:hypothetical protein